VREAKEGEEEEKGREKMREEGEEKEKD